MDACFQCKLCEVQCPYTPRDKHEYQLDFPKLVHRYKALRAKQHGGSRCATRVLGDPDGAGALARASFGLANVMNRVQPPPLVHGEGARRPPRQAAARLRARDRSRRWAEQQRADRGRARAARRCSSRPASCSTTSRRSAATRSRCWREPGEDGLRPGPAVLRHAGLGDGRPRLGPQAGGEQPRGSSLPFVEAGAKVLAINPTCSMMMRREYPELLPRGAAARRRAGSRALVRDPREFLWSIRNEPRFNTDFKTTPGGAVAYHAPCHLRAQGVGFKGRDLLRKIPGVVPKMTMECCGHDGTYAMTVEGFENSSRSARRPSTGMKDAGAEVWATDCPLAALQFAAARGKQADAPDVDPRPRLPRGRLREEGRGAGRRGRGRRRQKAERSDEDGRAQRDPRLRHLRGAARRRSATPR